MNSKNKKVKKIIHGNIFKKIFLSIPILILPIFLVILLALSFQDGLLNKVFSAYYYQPPPQASGIFCGRENQGCDPFHSCQDGTIGCKNFVCSGILSFIGFGVCVPSNTPAACDAAQISMQVSPTNSIALGTPITMVPVHTSPDYIDPTSESDTFYPDVICNNLNCTPQIAGTFTWTHTWRNCPPPPIGCSQSQRSNKCTSNSVSVYVGTPPPPGATNNLPCGTDINSAVCQTALGTFKTGQPESTVKTIYSIILAIAGAIITLLLLYAGYLLMTSAGDKQKIQAARELVIAAITGLLFIIFAFVIFQVLARDILHIPGIQ
ncbi:MAG: hypothetical protein A2857_02280 [Candidatus Levybacteria bacterium RIFCSPHIGHO2_01_FULL_36_15]|nr:MAG: hypothetical protein A2857_02280 [Candidatus Levybacteria bacterium RIFCSPHIGHO2_01_FULL_36_15]